VSRFHFLCDPISLSLSLSLDIPLRTADLSVRPFVSLSFTWQRLLGDMVPGNAIKLTHGASEETKACRYSWHTAGSLGWPFPAMKYKYIFFQIQYTEAILSNSTRKLLWFEISKMLIAVF